MTLGNYSNSDIPSKVNIRADTRPYMLPTQRNLQMTTPTKVVESVLIEFDGVKRCERHLP